MISFDGVRFSYGIKQVLKGVDFSINSHERVAILGGERRREDHNLEVDP